MDNDKLKYFFTKMVWVHRLFERSIARPIYLYEHLPNPTPPPRQCHFKGFHEEENNYFEFVVDGIREFKLFLDLYSYTSPVQLYVH